MLNEALDNLRNTSELLDLGRVVSTTEGVELYRACQTFAGEVENLRRGADEPSWREVLVPWLRSLPVAEVVDQDPLTNRARARPRGYPGDAVMIDLIYRDNSVGSLVSAATPRGRGIYEYASQSPASLAVRARKAWFSEELARLGNCNGGASAWSVGCGHLRELTNAGWVEKAERFKMLAMDMDAQSLAVVRRSFSANMVVTVHARAEELVSNRQTDEAFDFIYASGLYDYLRPRTARRLTRRLFQRVRPGGRLAIANLHAGLADRGYMEAFMDWWLVYRDTNEMEALVDCLPSVEIASYRVARDSTGGVLILEITRR